MNLQSLLANDIHILHENGTVTYDQCADEFIRRGRKSDKGARRATKNLARLDAWRSQIVVEHLEDRQAEDVSDAQRLAELREQCGTWAGAYIECGWKPARIAAARGISAAGISASRSAEKARRKNGTLSASEAAASLTLG